VGLQNEGGEGYSEWGRDGERVEGRGRLMEERNGPGGE